MAYQDAEFKESALVAAEIQKANCLNPLNKSIHSRMLRYDFTFK